MRPGLVRLGHDFGNGAKDELVFQKDAQAPRYARAKAAIDPSARASMSDPRGLCGRIVPWLIERVRNDTGESIPITVDDPPSNETIRQTLKELCDRVQEDLVLIERLDDGRDRVFFADVCFPSGWRPEHIVGESFRTIHVPVPGLLPDPARAASMVEAMTRKGPFVRFVWTLSADANLDHHPERGLRRSFEEPLDELWLRVERQVTAPFPELDATLFTIRTYLYPIEQLEAEQRSILVAAMEAMPEPVARYKNLSVCRATILRRLRGWT